MDMAKRSRATSPGPGNAPSRPASRNPQSTSTNKIPAPASNTATPKPIPTSSSPQRPAPSCPQPSKSAPSRPATNISHERFLPYAVFASVLAVFLYFMAMHLAAPAPSATYPPAPSAPTAPAACMGGENRTCPSGNCTGVMRCSSGAWGNCVVPAVCTPGMDEPCLRNGCVCGVKACDACGTGYGPCRNVSGSNRSCVAENG